MDNTTEITVPYAVAKPADRTAAINHNASSMPRKIRELIADLEKSGWHQVTGGKGSHRKFAHPDSRRKIILSGASGGDAHRYQEKAVKAAIREVTK